MYKRVQSCVEYKELWYSPFTSLIVIVFTLHSLLLPALVLAQFNDFRMLIKCQDSKKKTFFLPQTTHSVSSPASVIVLRALALLICAFLVAVSFCKLSEKSTSPSTPQTLSGNVIPPKPKPSNKSTTNNGGSGGVPGFQDLLELLPDQVTEHAQLVWQHGRDNQLVVVSAGLLTCLTAIFLAGPAR